MVNAFEWRHLAKMRSVVGSNVKDEVLFPFCCKKFSNVRSGYNAIFIKFVDVLGGANKTSRIFRTAYGIGDSTNLCGMYFRYNFG